MICSFRYKREKYRVKKRQGKTLIKKKKGSRSFAVFNKEKETEIHLKLEKLKRVY